MTAPALDERKEYWKWAYATKCFTIVKSAIEQIQQNPIPNEDIGLLFFAGIITTYSRPFTNCRGVGYLDRTIVPAEFQKEHDAILDLRDKALAHIDAVGYKADDPNYGNINRVVINKDKNTYGYTILLHNPYKTLKTLRIYELCCKILEEINSHMNRFEEKYIAGPELPFGNYLLNIDPLEKRPFVPIA